MFPASALDRVEEKETQKPKGKTKAKPVKKS
jgi:hypothetical protein